MENQDSVSIDIGGEPVATITFLYPNEEHQAQVVIATCCDSVSIFDEQTMTNVMLEAALWVSRKRKFDQRAGLAEEL